MRFIKADMKIGKLWFLGGAAGLFSLDQIMKSYAEQNLDKGEEKYLTDKVVLRRVHNKGMCLNLLDGQPETVKTLSLAATIVLTVLQIPLIFTKGRFWKKMGFEFLLSGAWSNTFDRAARGHVVDYIGFKTENEKVSQVTYNLGDFFIAAGSVILVLTALFSGSKAED